MWKNRVAAAVFLVSAALLASLLQESRNGGSIRGKEIQWKGPMGASTRDPNTIYLLMANGFLRAETSPTFDDLIATWLKQHPQSEAVPIFSFGPASRYSPNSKLTWVWVQEGKDSLNEHLVRQGGCSGSTMVVMESLPASDSEGSWQSDLYVSRGAYEQFLMRVRTAEEQARSQGLGIWGGG
jgi:hypothetical protein